MQNIKQIIKKLLSLAGLYHSALGIKISPEEKAKILLEYKSPNIDVFVETGTEFGTMIKSIGHHFGKVYSIELDRELYKKTKELFDGKENITLIQGDSAVELKNVLAELDRPALFWLDAHGSGTLTVKNSIHCPVQKELESIFAHHVKEHRILIDDARHFDRYSISIIKKLAKSNGYKFAIEDGLLRLILNK